MSEREIEQYIWLNAEKNLRDIRAGIMENFGTSKSLKWISKIKKEYLSDQSESLSTGLPEDSKPGPEDLELDPDIIAKKKENRMMELKIEQMELQYKLELKEAGIKEIDELIETDLRRGQQIIQFERKIKERDLQAEQLKRELKERNLLFKELEKMMKERNDQVKLLAVEVRNRKHQVEQLWIKLSQALSYFKGYVKNGTCPKCKGRFLITFQGNDHPSCFLCEETTLKP